MLFTDWTILRLLPPLRAAWAPVGSAGEVLITGQNAKVVLFGAINLRTAHRVIVARARAAGADARAFLVELRRCYRRWRTLWLLADRATGHTDRQTQALADRLDIRFVWLPTQAPELNAMHQLWRELKRVVAANRQALEDSREVYGACAIVSKPEPSVYTKYDAPISARTPAQIFAA